MTQDIDDIEKYAQAIMDVGAEVGSHIDGDARIQTFTFNEAQVVAFAELVAEEARREERERIVELVTRERTAGSMDEDGNPQDYYVDYDDLIAHLSGK